MVGDLAVQHRQQQHHHQRCGQHAGQGSERTTQAEVAAADHQRQVDHVRAGQDLRHRPVLHELFAGQPALLLDQLALHHGQHTAKSLQGQPGE